MPDTKYDKSSVLKSSALSSSALKSLALESSALRVLAATRMFVGPVLFCMVILYVSGCAPKRVIKKDTRSQTVAAEQRSSSSATGDQTQAAAAEPTDPASSTTQTHGIVDPEPADAPVAGMPQGDLSSLSLGLAAATLANEQIGKPYGFGGSGPERFDCSGLVQWVYGNLGVSLPRISRSQASIGREVNSRETRPGDLLFFALKGGSIDHVGIYTGNGKFVHAPRFGRPVSTDSLNNSWWRRRLRTVRRVE